MVPIEDSEICSTPVKVALGVVGPHTVAAYRQQQRLRQPRRGQGRGQVDHGAGWTTR
ncbi:hypothetical protein [Nocardia aurea]|uniref:hypothetical protein n=1 Tax=Nocardia aurea TaxID=2144174 RepID=UPI0018E50FA4|nr:hypothetical protein [Nocardia aurea]